MRLRLLIYTSLLSLLGCLQTGDGQGVAGLCTTTGFTSKIVFLVSNEGGLPNYFSGQINDSLIFDECQATDSYLYSIERTSSTSALISIWLPNEAKVHDLYFDENHQPKPNASVSYSLFGRTWCDDDRIIQSAGESALTWQPLFTEKASCPEAGYSAIVR